MGYLRSGAGSGKIIAIAAVPHLRRTVISGTAGCAPALPAQKRRVCRRRNENAPHSRLIIGRGSSLILNNYKLLIVYSVEISVWHAS